MEKAIKDYKDEMEDRIITDKLMSMGGIILAPFTGGASLGLTLLTVGVAEYDLAYLEVQKDQTLQEYQNDASFRNAWNTVYMTVQIVDGLASAPAVLNSISDFYRMVRQSKYLSAAKQFIKDGYFSFLRRVLGGGNTAGSVVKLTNKSSLSTTLFNQLDNALSSAPSIKFNYGSKALQSPQQFLNEVGDDMYDIVFSNGGYAKFDNATGRMLYSDGTNHYFIHFETGNNVTNVEQLLNTRVTQFRNYLGLNGPQTIQLTNGLGTITTSSSKATTFIGKTTETILLKNQFGNFKHYKVGESPGAVNLLNMPDTYWNPATWFEDYNKDWMLRAIQRGDDIYIASPINNGTLYNDYGGSYFAQELNELINAGLKPKNIDLNTWNSLKLDIITAAGTKY